MTPINPTRPHDTKVNASSPRRGALSRSRRHGLQLAYQGVTAAYIRDIARRPRHIATGVAEPALQA
jgi:hypothetical protein